jgi:hypothetical protein
MDERPLESSESHAGEPVSWAQIVGFIAAVWALLGIIGFLLLGWP